MWQRSRGRSKSDRAPRLALHRRELARSRRIRRRAPINSWNHNWPTPSGRLLEGEKKLADYQRRFAGQLPTELPGNLQAIANAQMQLQAVSESVNRARERRLLVERQLADAQTLPLGGVTAGCGGERWPPDCRAAASGGARAGLTRSSCSTRRIIQTCARWNALSAIWRRARTKRPAARLTRCGGNSVSPVEAARQKRIRDMTADLEVIDHQIAANQLEESNLKKTLSELPGEGGRGADAPG